MLDELNLASQPVLEGLNSCLDHRSSIYIPELDKVYQCPQSFRVFACQNPMRQGGGRKGLPESFLNRFTSVYVDQLTDNDMIHILSTRNTEIPLKTIEMMVQFNREIYEQSMVECNFGRKGKPWEFNLRDILRWIELMKSSRVGSKAWDPSLFLDLVYLQRMRTANDRTAVEALFQKVFGYSPPAHQHPDIIVTPNALQIGLSYLPRRKLRSSWAGTINDSRHFANLLVLHRMQLPLEHLMKCVEFNWMAIIIGSSGSGKTEMVKSLAALTGNHLSVFSMNSAVDTTELLGGFEQVNMARHKQLLMNKMGLLIAKIEELTLIE